MKKIFRFGLIFAAFSIFFGCTKNKDLDMKKNSYNLIINGYDWGPAADKLILSVEKSVKKSALNVSDFSVVVKTEVWDWSVMPPRTKTGAGNREILKAYLCSQDGTELTAEEESEFIALEMSVHPENPFSNPFFYGSDMMNHWQKIYEVTVKNEKLQIDINQENRKISPLADQFKMGKSTADSITLNYGFWEPENHGEKTPLIIWLHGMGEGGTDPYIALLGNKVVNLITDEVQKSFGSEGAFVLVPQVEGFWMQTKLGSTNFETWVSDSNPLVVSCYTKALFNLIDNFVKSNPEIDKDRIYIGGCSNGGYMTINMLLEYPDYFAAAYPVCQAYPDSKITEEKLNILKNQNIWFTQALTDKTVNPENYTIPTYERLCAAGAKNVHLSLWDDVEDFTGQFFGKKGEAYEYNGHFSWIYTLNNQCAENGIQIFKWLSDQKK